MTDLWQISDRYCKHKQICHSVIFLQTKQLRQIMTEWQIISQKHFFTRQNHTCITRQGWKNILSNRLNMNIHQISFYSWQVSNRLPSNTNSIYWADLTGANLPFDTVLHRVVISFHISFYDPWTWHKDMIRHSLKQYVHR